MAKIYSFDPQVYPLRLWVCVSPTWQELSRRFWFIDDDHEQQEIDKTTINEEWEACRLDVREKSTGTCGCIIVLVYPEALRFGLVVHECCHAYDTFAELLNLPYTGECRAYLTEWMAINVYDAWKKEVDKIQKQIE